MTRKSSKRGSWNLKKNSFFLAKDFRVNGRIKVNPQLEMQEEETTRISVLAILGKTSEGIDMEKRNLDR